MDLRAAASIPRRRHLTALALVCACYSGIGGQGGGDEGTGGDGGATEGGSDDGVAPAPEAAIPASGLRRLSRVEYDNTVRDLLGDDTQPGTMRLPADVIDPFDNDYTTQTASKPLVEGLEATALDIVDRLMQDATRRDEVIGCTPSGDPTTDAECVRGFVESFGRRALRRPLDDDEIASFTELAAAAPDVHAGAAVVIQAMLLDPELVYRVERGQPTEAEGVFRLSSFEVATRLSYLLLGTTPSEALLDLAEEDGLASPDQVRAAAEEMLDDPRTRERIVDFHAMWLGYRALPVSADLAPAMQQETRALVERVVFDEGASWLELFTAQETFVGDLLAEHYGLPAPGTDGPQWVGYGDSGRRGLLSHGAFLSVAAAIADTSPTRRGKHVRRRLMCQDVPPPPPDVDVDQAPQSTDSPCKWDAYAAHRDTGGACSGCHALMDPIGFGLENYDREGRFRIHDIDLPQCEITGEGDLDGIAFRGPAELADRLIESETLDACAVTHVIRFAIGRELDEEDTPLFEDLTEAFRTNDHRLDVLLLELVSSEAFGYRREESP